MKYCSRCGKAIDDDARFCIACGAQVDSDTLAEEKAFLQQTHRFLKYERLCWKIFGILFLVCSLLFIGVSLMWLALSFQMNFENGRIGMALAFGMYFAGGVVLYLPIAVVAFVMAKKASRYMNGIYTDPRPTLTRCDAVGPIVLAAFFNNLSLIFIIINFVRMRSNRSLVERIAQRYEQQ